MWYAITKKGKTWLTMACAMAMAADGVLFASHEKPWKPEAKEDGWRVLYVDGEMTKRAWKRRITVLHDGLKLQHPERLFTHLRVFGRRLDHPGGSPFPLLSEPASVAMLLKWFATEQWTPDVFVFDNLSTLSVLRSEIDGAAYAPLLESLAMLANAGISVLLVHHGRVKANSAPRSSPILEAVFDSVFQLVPLNAPVVDSIGPPASFTVQQTAQRDLWVPEFDAILQPQFGGGSVWCVVGADDTDFSLHPVGGASGRPKRPELQGDDPTLSIREAAKKLGVSRAAVERHRKRQKGMPEGELEGSPEGLPQAERHEF